MLLSHHAYSFSSPLPLSLTRLSSSIGIGMLAASPFRNSTAKAGSTQIPVADDFLVEFDFTELFAGVEDGGAWLGLDADASEILADFPSPEGAEMEVEMMEGADACGVEQERAKVVAGREETVSDKLAEDLCGGTMTQELMTTTPDVNSWVPQKEKGRKPSARQEKSSNGKRKMKVDWTPELHRQFLQAVEQLGVDKAVPSKILELMGIRRRLTRHNIASHLQKYRSHRKHKLVGLPVVTTAGSLPMGEDRPWIPGPAMGFPSSHFLPSHLPEMGPCTPLHVWGHPTVNQSVVHTWQPMHLHPIKQTHSTRWGSPCRPFLPPISSGTISQGIPFFPHQTPVQRYAALHVVGIPQQPIYRPEKMLPAARLPIPPPIYLTCWQSQIHHDEQPSKESIDAAIEEVLAHPWLPLSLGLKPPSLESLMMELEKRGIHTVLHETDSLASKFKFIRQFFFFVV